MPVASEPFSKGLQDAQIAGKFCQVFGTAFAGKPAVAPVDNAPGYRNNPKNRNDPQPSPLSTRDAVHRLNGCRSAVFSRLKI